MKKSIFICADAEMLFQRVCFHVYFPFRELNCQFSTSKKAQFVDFFSCIEPVTIADRELTSS